MKYKLLFFCLLFVAATSISLFFDAKKTLASSTGEFLTLPECVKIALAKTPEMYIAKADISEKEETLESLKKDRYPTLSTYYQYKKDLDSVYAVEDFYGYGVTLEQPIYVGKSIVTAIEVGQLDKKSSDYGRQAAINAIALKTYLAYYSLLKSAKLEEVAIQAIELLQSHLKDAKAFYDAGLIPKNDLLISELELAQGQQDFLKASNNVKLSRSALNIILQRNPVSPLQVVDNVIYKKRPIIWDDILNLALKQRPELHQYKLGISKSELNKTLTTAQFLPSVVLSASYSKQGDSPLANNSTNPFVSDEIRSAEATASWQFWSWGQKKNKISAAERQIDKAKASLRQREETIILEARLAFLAADESQKNILVTEKAIEQAEENYRIVQGRFQAQLATSTEVLDAQTLLTEARSNYFNALYDYNIALARLDRSTGTLGVRQQ